MTTKEMVKALNNHKVLIGTKTYNQGCKIFMDLGDENFKPYIFKAKNGSRSHVKDAWIHPEDYKIDENKMTMEQMVGAVEAGEIVVDKKSGAKVYKEFGLPESPYIYENILGERMHAKDVWGDYEDFEILNED